MTTLKATIKESTVSNNTGRYDSFNLKGICIINDKERNFQVLKTYAGNSKYESIATIDGINTDLLKELNIEIDDSELVEAFENAYKKNEEEKARKVKIVRGNKYDNHPLHWYRKTFSDWKLSYTKEDFCENSFKDLSLIQGQATIIYNDKGQYQLTFNHNRIKKSKKAETVEAAYQEHIKILEQRKTNAKLEQKERQQEHTLIEEKLGLPITEIEVRHSRGHGRTFRSYISKHFQFLIKDAEYESDKKYIRFHIATDKNEIKIDDFNFGTLTLKQLNKIIEEVNN